jgi:AcrR family transcriptional regulator
MNESTPGPVAPLRRQRADARRNVERLVAAARAAFTEHGAEASLDDIARRAGVGPGTLYRHFPTRQSLIEAVYRDGVTALCAEGDRLLEAEPPAAALFDWLRAYVAYVAEKRGLANSLMVTIDKNSPLMADLHAMIGATGTALLDRARAAGAVRGDLELNDVIRLGSAIAYASEQSSDSADLSDRLLRLAIEGFQPRFATT